MTEEEGRLDWIFRYARELFIVIFVTILFPLGIELFGMIFGGGLPQTWAEAMELTGISVFGVGMFLLTLYWWKSFKVEAERRREAEKREDFLHFLLRHDLRNKTQITRGYLELLEDFDLPAVAERYVEKAMKGVREAMDLIEKVRTLRKAEQEEAEETDIASTVQEGLERWRSLAEERDMEIMTEFPEEDENVKAGALLNEALSNVVENAIQHSKGSRVKISLTPDDGEIVCTVEDDGRGIPDEEKEKIFNRSYTTDEERGSGLGMFLVNMLLESYGGNIVVKDSELGGARFDVRLKKA